MKGLRSMKAAIKKKSTKNDNGETMSLKDKMENKLKSKMKKGKNLKKSP